MGVRKKREQLYYLEVNGSYEQMGTGFTDLNEAPSAQTTSKQYINEASATQSVTSYEWSAEFTADQIINEKVIEHIINIGEMQLTGADVETNIVIMDSDKPASGGTGAYRARKINVAISVDSFDNNDGELQVTGTFLGQGDTVEGTFDLKTKAFTNGFTPVVAVAPVLNFTMAATLNNDETQIQNVDVKQAPTNKYFYNLGSSALTLNVGDDGSIYMSWDGSSPIQATSGQTLNLIEADSKDKVVKVGSKTVVVKTGTTTPVLASGLTVTSVESATDSGKTKLTVTPAKASGNSYKYVTGPNVNTPNVGDILTTGFVAWNGTDEITAKTGDTILVVEADSQDKAVKAGQSTVASKA